MKNHRKAHLNLNYPFLIDSLYTRRSRLPPNIIFLSPKAHSMLQSLRPHSRLKQRCPYFLSLLPELPAILAYDFKPFLVGHGRAMNHPFQSPRPLLQVLSNPLNLLVSKCLLDSLSPHDSLLCLQAGIMNLGRKLLQSFIKRMHLKLGIAIRGNRIPSRRVESWKFGEIAFRVAHECRRQDLGGGLLEGDLALDHGGLVLLVPAHVRRLVHLAEPAHGGSNKFIVLVGHGV